jgi:hypothetical protein
MIEQYKFQKLAVYQSALEYIDRTYGHKIQLDLAIFPSVPNKLVWKCWSPDESSKSREYAVGIGPQSVKTTEAQRSQFGKPLFKVRISVEEDLHIVGVIQVLDQADPLRVAMLSKELLPHKDQDIVGDV